MCTNYLDEDQEVVLGVKLDVTLKILWVFLFMSVLLKQVTLR